MLLPCPVNFRGTLPVRDRNTVVDKNGAVVHRGGKKWSRGVNVLTRGKHSHDGEAVQRSRDLETELNSGVPLVYSAQREVSEGVFEVVIDTHHIGLVGDVGVEPCQT